MIVVWEGARGGDDRGKKDKEGEEGKGVAAGSGKGGWGARR